MYHLRFKEIYHLDEAINDVILRANHSRCKIPEFFVRKNYVLVAINHCNQIRQPGPKMSHESCDMTVCVPWLVLGLMK